MLCHTNPKYSQIFRLENYYFFFASMSIRKYELLKDHINQAETMFEKSLNEYCDTLLNDQFENQLSTLSEALLHIHTKGYDELQYHIQKAKFIKVYCNYIISYFFYYLIFTPFFHSSLFLFFFLFSFLSFSLIFLFFTYYYYYYLLECNNQ